MISNSIQFKINLNWIELLKKTQLKKLTNTYYYWIVDINQTSYYLKIDADMEHQVVCLDLSKIGLSISAKSTYIHKYQVLHSAHFIKKFTLHNYYFYCFDSSKHSKVDWARDNTYAFTTKYSITSAPSEISWVIVSQIMWPRYTYILIVVLQLQQWTSLCALCRHKVFRYFKQGSIT